jgi:hypothetical protein
MDILILAFCSMANDCKARIKRVLDAYKECSILGFGYNDIAELTIKEERFLFKKIDLTSNTQSQASEILGSAERLKKGKNNLLLWILIDNAFPAGLYEELTCQLSPNLYKDSPEQVFWNLPNPRPFYLTEPKLGSDEPFSHKKPNEPIKWQDTEFARYLFDIEEIRQIETALKSKQSVLITGDVGTGKTLLARYIHYHTIHTANGLFVERNFAAIPEGLLEAELFGTLKGIATEVTEREGLLQAANGGTLFFDEIAESDEKSQIKLLRVVSDRIEPATFHAIGQTGEGYTVNTRFIAATNLPENFHFESI